MKRISTAPQKKRPTVMEMRMLEAMLQVAKETAEEEGKAREVEKEVEKREILELRQATAALRKEKEAYEAMYGHSELGSLRDDSVRSNSLKRAMAGRSETSHGPTEEIRTRDDATAQHANTKVKSQAKPCRHHGSLLVHGTSWHRGKDQRIETGLV